LLQSYDHMYCSFMHSVTSQLIIAYLASECKYTDIVLVWCSC